MRSLYTIIVLSVLLIVALGVIVGLVIRVKDKCTQHCTQPSGPPSSRHTHHYMRDAVNYDPADICKANMSTCLADNDSSPDCKLIKSQQVQPFFGYKINLLGTDPTVKGMDCNFKYTNTQVCTNNGKSNNWNDQGRPVWVYFPNTVLRPTADVSKIPYVIYYSFTQWNTTDLNAESLAKQGYGLFNPDRCNNCTTVLPCSDAPMSPVWMQLQLQGFLAAGYAVVLTTMIADDSYIYQETCPPPLLQKDNLYNLCWNNGDNPDARYLKRLFSDIADGTLFKNKLEVIPSDPTLGTLAPGAADFFNTSPNLSTTECGLIGYSVGAQMVSRSINEFGRSGGVLSNAPRVAVACMISGGSLHCYEYCNGDQTTARGIHKALCDKQPNSWGPCWNKDSLGCCPEGLTEPRYDSPNNTETHPPVILVQTDFDYYADPRASENYYRALQAMLPESVRDYNTQIVHGLCGNHNLFPSAIFPVLTFFGKFM